MDRDPGVLGEADRVVGRDALRAGAVREQEDREQRLAVLVGRQLAVLVPRREIERRCDRVADCRAGVRLEAVDELEDLLAIIGRLGERRGSGRERDEPDSDRSGSPVTKLEAASFAAASRVGGTSVAIIEPETSIASTTLASSRGTAIVVSGRASATSSAARAASAKNGGRCRRQPGERSTTFESRSRFVNRIAYFTRRRCTSRYATTRTGIRASERSAAGQAKLIAASSARA